MSSKAARTRSEPVTLPRLGLAGTLRWIWTQLTSMSTALMLLLLLAVAAVPGSLVPQRRAGPEIVDQWIEDNPVWGPVLDALQFFDVYNSVWFSAIYLLLFVSLVGCVWPRAIQHAKALRQPPARTRNLTRLPASGVVVLEEGGPSPEEAVARAQAWLRKRRYRVEHRPEASGASVGAERGYLREIGNILFHVSLIGVLVFMAYGGMTKYYGQKIIVEGEGFANNLVSYDSFTPGTYFSADDLQPFSLTLDSFDVVFDRESEALYGQPLDYTAVMQVQEGGGGEPREEILKVNHPLSMDGVRVYLVGNGYAPVLTVRDGEGDIAFQGPVVTRVQDVNFNSLVTLKVPDARPDQLGFVGQFMPAAVEDESGVAVSVDPELYNPQLILDSYYGDLGLDGGVPQNVYVLDTETLTELNSRKNENGGIVLSQGQTYELPEGKGSISFDGVRRYVGLDIHYDPGKWGVGVFAGTALLGLAISLFVRRRRVWVRARTDEAGRTRVEYALLARGEEFGLHEEHVALRAAMEKWWPVAAATAPETTPETPCRPRRRPIRRLTVFNPTAPVNEQLALYSDLFMLIAAFVYAAAFVLFTIDMATSSATIRRLEEDLAAQRGPARLAPARETVGAGFGGSSLGGSSSVGSTGAGSSAGGPGVLPGEARAAGLGDEPGLVDEDMDYTGGGRRPIANVAVAVLAVGWALHAFAVIARGLAASRVPWGNLYEFMTTGALVITTVYLLFLFRKDLRFVGTFVTGLVVAMMCAATMGFPTPVGHLQPPLQSPWLVIHVSIAVLATALFTLTAAMSMLQLIQDRAEKRAAATGERPWAFLRLVPSAQALENWSYRINAVGFVMWTFTLIAGAIWAEASWGRYWNWDTKEVWTFVIWVVYAAYLHARATRGWTGARAAWLSIVGFLCVVFNYTIVNTYFPGLHSYAGLPG